MAEESNYYAFPPPSLLLPPSLSLPLFFPTSPHFMHKQAGPYVRLELGQDRAFFIDSGPLSHAFVPCGHVTTERTTQSVLTTHSTCV